VQADSPPPPLSTGQKVALTWRNTNYTPVIASRRIASFRCIPLHPAASRGLDPDTCVRSSESPRVMPGRVALAITLELS